MGGKPAAPPVPEMQPITRIPDPKSKALAEEGMKKQRSMMAMQGRESTNLSDDSSSILGG
jgi:hypothetical protein